MSKLTRNVSGIFNVDNAVKTEELKNADDIFKYIVPADSVISFPKIILEKEKAKKLLDGVYEKSDYADGLYRVYNGSEFWGVGEVSDKILKMKSYVRE